MDNSEWGRRVKRYMDVNYSYRRLFILTVGIFGLIWLFGIRFIPSNIPTIPEPVETCLQRKLLKAYGEVSNMDTNIVHIPPLEEENNILPYVGNGYIGSALYEEANINIKSKNGRTLSVPIPFRPIVRVYVTDEDSRREAMVSQYVRGIVQRVSCIERGGGNSVEVVSTFYAHRTYPSVFEQDVFIRNHASTSVIVEFDQLGWTGDPPFKSDIKKIQQGDGELSYVLGSGIIEVDNHLTVVAVAYKKVLNAHELESNKVLQFRFLTVVNYAPIATKNGAEPLREQLLDKSEKELKKALGQNVHNFQELHKHAWGDLWTTGFYLSPSRATGALNGDKINATMHHVLSQVRAPLHEANVNPIQVAEANAVLAYAEGCYGGHHTLQAQSLWSSLQSEAEILSVSNLWLLTLQKLGCHKLVRAGASGVMQAMVLSFGGLKFSNHHLEFNTEPKDLHRDYHFRRIAYGNATHVNISVSVRTDNKAVLHAALDRSDKDYYACDAGCLDTPVQLGPVKKQFPVKLTDPVTSILYITSDRMHVEELRLSIHVKEILEAPAHEHHVISMHKHGSGYGAMSTMFWVSISLLIIVFHLFLFHLVYTEYFGTTQEKFRSR